MANIFFGRGNLGADPELRYVSLSGVNSQEAEQAPVLNLRVFFDRPKPDGQGGFKDKGGFWLNVSWWSTQVPNAAKLLRKGARVAVEGSLMMNTWVDKETGEEKSNLVLQANRVDLDLGRVEQVTMRSKTDNEQQQQPAGQAQSYADQPDDWDQELPF